MYLDNITNKLYPFIMVLMSKKNIESYEEIFKNIKSYINKFSETEELNLKSYCTDYEEALFKGFHNIFSNSKNYVQHIGCYFHYLQACRRKLQALHFTSKKNINIYNDFMNKFGYFAFLKNISKKRILKELNNIEKKYNLNHHVSNYFKDTWIKYLLDKTISYNNIPKNMRIVNSIEIFNRYFQNHVTEKV